VKPKRVCVVGNFSGRNAGDAAILDGLMRDVQRLVPNIVFDVPTINKDFVRRRYADMPVEPRGLMPWNLSVKILGLPILMSIYKSDVVLVTDAILFDRKLLNPLYNYLFTMAGVLPWARRLGKPVLLYNVSLGPVSSPLGIQCLRRVIDSANKIVLRDRESSEMCARLGIEMPSYVEGADCALNVRATAGHELAQLFERAGLGLPSDPYITVNINSYLDVFLQRDKQTNPNDFVDLMAGTIDRLIEHLGHRVIFVETQPMDLELAHKVFRAVQNQDAIYMIDNRSWSHRDLAGVFSGAQMHIGMRTHSLILASAMHTPVVGIICTPKNRGFMRSIDQDEFMVEFDNFTAETFYEICVRAWQRREQIRASLADIIGREQLKAESAAKLVVPYLTP
jgi:polysaccharide pyruvyl transferase WcaK-like protein